MASWLRRRLFCDRHGDLRFCDVIDDFKNETAKVLDHGKASTSSAPPPPPPPSTVTLPVTVTPPPATVTSLATITPPPAPQALSSPPLASASDVPPALANTSTPANTSSSSPAPSSASNAAMASIITQGTAASLTPQAVLVQENSAITTSQLVAISVGLLFFLLATLAGFFVWFRCRRQRLRVTTARRRLRLDDERTRTVLGGADAARGAGSRSPTSPTSPAPASLPKTRAAAAPAGPVEAALNMSEKASASEFAAVGIAAPLSIRRVRLVDVGSKKSRAGHGGKGGGGGGGGEGGEGDGRGVQIVHVGTGARSEQLPASGPEVALATRQSRASNSDGGGAPGMGSTARTDDPFNDPSNVVHG